MAETEEKAQGRKNEKVGEVVSTKMTKTIVVEVSRRVPHPLYKRIIQQRKKFYAHDEQSAARIGRRGANHRVPAVEQAEAVDAGGSDPPGGPGGCAAEGPGRKGLTAGLGMAGDLLRHLIWRTSWRATESR